jgi:hypothetical protein
MEREVDRLACEFLSNTDTLTFYPISVLDVIIKSTEGQEARRQQLLEEAGSRTGAMNSIVRLWARALCRSIEEALSTAKGKGRPVIILQGLAALHPLSDPTQFMEALAEQEPRDPATNRVVPVVLFVPGTRPPQTSRTYLFLGLDTLRRSFYRGEEA